MESKKILIITLSSIIISFLIGIYIGEQSIISDLNDFESELNEQSNEINESKILIDYKNYCEADGGKLEESIFEGVFICIYEYLDGDKQCLKNSDCQGLCIEKGKNNYVCQLNNFDICTQTIDNKKLPCY